MALGSGPAAARGARRRPTRAGREPDPAWAEETGTARDADADPVSAARTICLNLLTARARTRAELADALARRGVADDVAAGVLDRLAELNLLDDAAFAQQWVASRHRDRGLGRRALADELRRKGVEKATVDEALSDLDRDDERERARELVARRVPSLDRADTPTAARRLVGMLARKGYPPGLAHEVVREALDARAQERGEDAGSLDGHDDAAGE